jgi:predicted FMN-binding regulatory protein PaiB
VALFGMTAGQWRKINPDKQGNIRDHASAVQLKILVNLENLNAAMIKDELPQAVRLEKLRGIVGEQMEIFGMQEVKKLNSNKE